MNAATTGTGLDAIRARYAAIDEPCGNVAVVIDRMRASAADVPVLLAAWKALKEDLTKRVEQDLAQHQAAMDAGGVGAASYGGLVSANRSTLAKMRELVAGS